MPVDRSRLAVRTITTTTAIVTMRQDRGEPVPSEKAAPELRAMSR